jgi:hypothetical protein
MDENAVYTLKSIDRNKPAGRAIGEYADIQYWSGFRTGILLGVLVGGILAWRITKLTQ